MPAPESHRPGKALEKPSFSCQRGSKASPQRQHLVLWPLKGFQFAHFLVLERIAKIGEYSWFSFEDKDGCCSGDFVFPVKSGLPISSSALSVLPVPRAGGQHDPPVSCPQPFVPTEENIGESPEECESNKLQHLDVYLTFGVYRAGWPWHERGFHQLVRQLD